MRGGGIARQHRCKAIRRGQRSCRVVVFTPLPAHTLCTVEGWCRVVACTSLPTHQPAHTVHWTWRPCLYAGTRLACGHDLRVHCAANVPTFSLPRGPAHTPDHSLTPSPPAWPSAVPLSPTATLPAHHHTPSPTATPSRRPLSMSSPHPQPTKGKPPWPATTVEWIASHRARPSPVSPLCPSTLHPPPPPHHYIPHPHRRDCRVGSLVLRTAHAPCRPQRTHRTAAHAARTVQPPRPLCRRP